MAITQKQYIVTDAATKTYAYGDIATWDGTTINDSDILRVYVNGGLVTLTSDYTVNDVDEDIVFEVSYSLVIGDVISIKRITDIDTPYVDFTNNTTIEANDLDLAIGQNRFKIQELDTDLSNVLGLDTVNDCWDAESKKICNLASGTASTDAVNYGQVVALISGTDISDTGDGIYQANTGDGSTDTFTLTDFPTTEVDPKKIIVTLDGLVQRPTSDYSYALSASSVPTVVFVEAPPNDTLIGFRTVAGIVSSSYAGSSIDGDVIITNTLDGDRIIDGTLDGDALVDQSVDISKLDGGTGVAKRFLVFTTFGVGSARTITHEDITHTGPGTRTDIGDSQIDDSHIPIPVNLTTTPTYTNSTSATQYMVAQIRVQVHGGTITLTPSGGTPVTMLDWAAPGGAVQDIPISFFVPPNGVVTFTSGGGTLRQIVTQEV